jgi:hypothetical protein
MTSPQPITAGGRSAGTDLIVAHYNRRWKRGELVVDESNRWGKLRNDLHARSGYH